VGCSASQRLDLGRIGDAEDTLDRGLLRRIALGGLLNGPSRVAPFHARIGSGD
jgi:hypothetical protein